MGGLWHYCTHITTPDAENLQSAETLAWWWAQTAWIALCAAQCLVQMSCTEDVDLIF